jgi:HEAT repeat protein
MTAITARDLRAQLDAAQLDAGQAIEPLISLARAGTTRPARLDAAGMLGELAGRAHGARWEVAERAAWALLELARLADAAADRRGVILAMGRGFRNLWLLPYVHRRLSDGDPRIVAAAINAAGGLGFPALEEAVAAFLDEGAPRPLRKAAIAALGRMGATSSVDRLVPLVGGDPDLAAAALDALTEIRSSGALAAARAALDQSPEREVRIAALRYLSELGSLDGLPTMRRLSRDDAASARLAASFASRALKAERTKDAGERFLIALTERDRAVRAVLARRLRTVPIALVLEHAELLISEDAEGVVQILGELREPEITRYLLAIAGNPALPDLVRARAVGSIEANLPWERDALAAIIADTAAPEMVRAAAAQTVGAFVSVDDVLAKVGVLASAPAPALRGAYLWALQLAARPGRVSPADTARLGAAVKALLADADASVRRRAAYVAGNLGLTALAPDLAALAGTGATPELRLAGLVALGELLEPSVFEALVAASKKEDDPRVLSAASRTLAGTALAHPDRPLSLAPLAGKLGQLLGHADPIVREAGVRLAGLAKGAVNAAAILKLATDPTPAVRAEALTALGRLATPECEAPLLAAFADADPALHERAAEALLALGGRRALEQVLDFVAGEGDDDARAAVAARFVAPPQDADHLLPRVDHALTRLGPDDPAFEPLLNLKVALLEVSRGDKKDTAADIDDAIVAAFPSFAHMLKLPGFDSLIKSLRTAESLYRSTSAIADADASPPIVLWMKVLENYVHAWLGGRLSTMQRDPMALFDYVDRVVGSAWPSYQRWVGERWPDPVAMGTAKVEVPLRSVPNALKEFQEHRRKRLDSPLSITEWARMIVFFAVDHPSGVKNLFRLPIKTPEQIVRLAHRLHALAAVRNLVTHRSAASAATVDGFRKGYYAAFEDLAQMA